MGKTYYIGQRLSLQAQSCTLRYTGLIPGKTAEWLGVEWDDPLRGKNDGTHDGVRYFTCRSRISTAASFLRPTQPWDKPRTFLDALREKYVRIEDAQPDEVVFISHSKQIEEVGFEKFARRQAELRGIHVLVLDHMQIAATTADDSAEIERICANITDLDLGGNLFEDFDDVLDLCSHLPKLKQLTLDGNRFEVRSIPGKKLEGVHVISLSNTLLHESELAQCLLAFPAVTELIFANNRLVDWHSAQLSASLRSIDLSRNDISVLDDISIILALPVLHSLSLKENRIISISRRDKDTVRLLSNTLQELDLSRNLVCDWMLFDGLQIALPQLKSLRVSGNPLYADLCSAMGKPLAAEDGYMLTIARLPSLRMLNYSTITDKDRLNADKYYLDQIAAQLSLSSPKTTEDILIHHPRWQALIAEYGEPMVSHKSSADAIDPGSLAARLVYIHFHLDTDEQTSKQWVQEVPRAYNIYALYGLVAKSLNILPIHLRLVWETGEKDPVSHQQKYQGPQDWDSSDEEDMDEGAAWTMRSVELVPGTRSIGTYFEDRHVDVQVRIARA